MRIAGYFLLVLYLIGISPSMIIHHHKDKIIAFTKATQCEKDIYYGISEFSHYHKQHISRTPDNCWICDHHTVTPQILFNCRIAVPGTGHAKPHAQWYESYHSTELIHAYNKDPPIV